MGLYKNITDLEDSISLPEMQSIIEVKRDEQDMHRRFLAAIEGVDLDGEDDNDAEGRLAIIQARADARARGENPEVGEMDFFDLDFETD